MMLTRLLVTLGCGLILLLQAGCETTRATPQTKRINEHQGAYNELSDSAKAGVAQGFIARGQNLKTAYLALGKPDIIRTSADGQVSTWTYLRFLPPESQKDQAEVVEKKKLQQAQRSAMHSDPLIDTMEAWRHGVLRHAVTDDEPDLAPKSMNQSWGDYARYVQQRRFIKQTMPGPPALGGLTGVREGTTALKIVDDKAWDEYYEAETTNPSVDPEFVNLDVIFIEQLVSDAIVNDSYSAFVSQVPSP